MPVKPTATQPASTGPREVSRFSSSKIPFSFMQEMIEPFAQLETVIVGKEKNKVIGDAVFSTALMIPGLIQDSVGVVSTMTGGAIKLEWLGAQAAQAIESLGTVNVEELVRQAMASITQTAFEIQNGNFMTRMPITPAIHLYAAEYVVAKRGVEEKAKFLDIMMESCALLSKSFEGKDVKGMLMARMLYEATDGIVARSIKADAEHGSMKSEHTVDRAIQSLNRAVQNQPDELIAGLGIYASTAVVPVFGVPKSDAQMRIANELLFANRNISTQRVFLEGVEPSSITKSIIAGFEFLEGDENASTNNRMRLEEAKEELARMKSEHPLSLASADYERRVAEFERRVRMESEMQRLNMDAIIVSVSPAMFVEELGLADNGRGHNRAIVKPEKYGDGGASGLTSEDTANTSFAKTGKFASVADRMKGKMVIITPGTKKGPHGGVEPDVFLRTMYQATAPNDRVRTHIGNMTKLIDKMGPRNTKFGLCTIPLSSTEQELEILYKSVTAKNTGTNDPKIKIIERTQLKPVAEAMARTTNLILGEILAEIQAKAGKRKESVDDTPPFADDDPAYTAKLVYRLGRLLEQDFVGKNLPAVGEVATQFNDFLIDVYTGRLEVTPEVEVATRMVFETSFAHYPRKVQIDFLNKLITRGITDPEQMNKWFDVLYPVAVREQGYIPVAESEVHGVRPAEAMAVLKITRGMVDVFPDLGDQPKALMEHVLEGDDTFIASALKLTWAVGNKLHARKILSLSDEAAVKKPGTGEGQRKLLKDLNDNLDTLRKMLIGRLEREFAYEMRAKSPLAQFGNIEKVLGLAEGFASQIVEVQDRFMHAFAATCALFQEDVLIVDNAADPKNVALQTVPKSADSAEAMIDIAVGAPARNKIRKMRTLMQNEAETGELDILLGRARKEFDDRDELAEEILSRAFAEGGARDVILAEAAGDMLGKVLGIPTDVPREGEKPATEKSHTSSRLRSLFTLWNGGYGSYGKSIALMAILTANQQSGAAGADSIARIVETLTRAERDGLKASVDLFDQTGEIGYHKSVTDIGKELSIFTIGQVKNAEQADAIRGQVLIAVAEQAKSSLARLTQIEGQLVELHAQNNELQIETYRQKIALRRQAINANVTYAQKELAAALNAIYREREQLVQSMGAIRASAVKNRLEVLDFLGDVFDPDGDYQTKRIALMRYIRKYTSADYAIAMPPEQVIFDLVGLSEEEVTRLAERKEKKTRAAMPLAA